MKKKLFSILALMCLIVTGAWAESFTITFKSGTGASDGSAAKTSIEDIIADGATYVSELNATKVFQGKEGYGIKLGTGSATGSLTLTLANEAKNVTSIVVNAQQYKNNETTLKIQDKDYTTTNAFADYTYTYATPASVSTITLATTTKRGYIKSVTVNYTVEQQGSGDDPQPQPTVQNYYYVVGNVMGWAADNKYKMTQNKDALPVEEYMFTLNLKTTDMVKVLGVKGEDQTWYPDGNGNCYGENGEIKEDGTYTIYFRPNGDGNADWFNNCLYLAPAVAGEFQITTGATEQGTITYTVNGMPAISANEGDVVTVTLNPDEGWAAGTVSGQWYAAMATSRGQQRIVAEQTDIELLNGIEFTPVDGTDNQWTFTMARANAEISATYRKQLTNTDITIDDIGVVVNNGGLTPTLIVKDGDKVLTLGTDYTVQLQKKVSGSEWTNAEELSVGEFRYVITGIGKYNDIIYTDGFQPYAIYVYYEAGETRGDLYITHEGPDSKRIVTISVEPREGFQLKDIVAKIGGEEIPLTKITETEPWEATAYTFVMPAGNVEIYPIFDIYENTSTGVSEELRVKSEEYATATWYDLNGRKLNAIPTKKGVYVVGGKLVVIK